jgi:putative addiction module antidote
MTAAIKLVAIGNSTGVVLPKDVLARLKLSKGDMVFLSESPDGLILTPYDPDFAEAMEATGDYMRRHRDALKELAK